LAENNIQVNYDALNQIGRQFKSEAEQIGALQRSTRSRLPALVGSEWRGVAAEAFYSEMENVLLPAMGRLEQALLESGRMIGQIGQTFWDAEEEARQLFSANEDALNPLLLVEVGGGGVAAAATWSIPGLPFFVSFKQNLYQLLPDWLRDSLHLNQTETVETKPATGYIPQAWLDNNTSASANLNVSVDEAVQPGKEETTSKFGELMQKQSQETVVQTATQVTHFDVPVKSQNDLTYAGKKNGYGCAPTSASMILDYWHQQNESNRTISSQALLDLNVKEKQFTGAGLSFDKLEDDLTNLGYHPHLSKDSSQEALQKAVESGPVMAVVRTGLTTNGYAHAVVVTGVKDGQVYYNDPLTVKETVATWDEFDKSWGSNFGSGVATRVFLEITPAAN
jgi:WXG100 family type VII secretion target